MTQDEQFLRAIQATILKELREFLGTSSDDPLLRIKHVLGSIYDVNERYMSGNELDTKLEMQLNNR